MNVWEHHLGTKTRLSMNNFDPTIANYYGALIQDMEYKILPS